MPRKIVLLSIISAALCILAGTLVFAHFKVLPVTTGFLTMTVAMTAWRWNMTIATKEEVLAALATRQNTYLSGKRIARIIQVTRKRRVSVSSVNSRLEDLVWKGSIDFTCKSTSEATTYTYCLKQIAWRPDAYMSRIIPPTAPFV